MPPAHRQQGRGVWSTVVFAVLLAACAPSRETLQAVAAHHPGALFSVATPDSVVALTLDDGPDLRRTSAVLDVLAEHGATATFFVIGRKAAEHPALLAQIAREGHELGNHGWQTAPPVLLGATTTGEHIDRTAAVLAPYGPVRWFRPGTGLYTTAIRDAAEARGYRIALGSVYPNDPWVWSVGRQARTILRDVRPGSVIVLHDGIGWRTRAPAVLARVLPELRRRGYRVVSLSELADR